MRIIRFTIKQVGQDIGSVPIREQAVAAAKARAQRTGIPVSVIARWDNGKEREVVFHLNGASERISK